MYRSKRVGIYVKYCNSGALKCDRLGNIYQKGKLKPAHIDKDGYMCTFLDGVEIPNHQIIAYLKFGKEAIKPGIVTRHLDDCKSNNTWDNIGIGTPLDNSKDMTPGKLSASAKRMWATKSSEYRTQHFNKAAAGVSKENRTIRAKKANAAMTPEVRKAAAKKIMAARGFKILTEQEQQAIRYEYALGNISQYNLAHKYGIAQSRVSNIVRGTAP